MFSNFKIENYKLYQQFLVGKNGIEIGGPSPFFQRVIPIYNKINSLDGVNFSASTVWEGQLVEGNNFKYGNNKTGFQYILDGTNLNEIESDKYDFVISCNNLEHIANPFKAIKEWLRIIKSGGLILLVLPNKDSNFDHNRQVTKFEHLLDDFKKNIAEDDLTHMEEILQLHDLSMDLPAGSYENFKARSLKNAENRCFHHHVFDMDLLKQIFRHFQIELLLTDCTKSDFIMLGKI